MISYVSPVDCGPLLIDFYLNDGAKTSLSPLLFEVRDSPDEFVRIFAADNSLADTFEILYTVTLSLFPNISVESAESFTIEIKQRCIEASLLAPSVLDNQEYTITDFEKSYIFNPFFVVPEFCEIEYTYTVSSPSAQLIISSFDGDLREFKFLYSDDLRPSGEPSFEIYELDYSISVTGTTGMDVSKNITGTFSIKIKNPCIDPNFVSIQTVPFATGPFFYTLYFGSLTQPE